MLRLEPCKVLNTLALPDALNPLVVYSPTSQAQQFGDFAIAVAAALPGKLVEFLYGGRPLKPRRMSVWPVASQTRALFGTGIIAAIAWSSPWP